jgi:hypothetical protein
MIMGPRGVGPDFSRLMKGKKEERTLGLTCRATDVNVDVVDINQRKCAQDER